MLIALALMAVLVVGAFLVAGRPRKPASTFAHALRRTVVLHRRGQPSLRGVLIAEYADGVALAHAEYLQEPSQPGEVAPPAIPLDGEVLVLFDTLDFAQELAPRTGDSAATRPEQTPRLKAV